MARFRKVLFDFVATISKDYRQDKKIDGNPELSHALWVAGYQWAKKNKTIELKDADSSLYMVAARDLTVVPASRKKAFKSFEEFTKHNFSFWCVHLSDWKTGDCSCPIFLKEFVCKHVLGLAIRLKLVEVPVSAKGVALGQKPKRGRPKKARKALLMD